MRSKMSTFASTAMPTVSAIPAMPGSVSVAPKAASAARISAKSKITASAAKEPEVR